MKLVATFILICCFHSLVLPQTPEKPSQVDWFGKIGGDDLQAHVYVFQNELAKNGSTGLAVLSGPGLIRYINQRRIIGCSRFMKMPEERIRFRFANDEIKTGVEFWEIPKGFVSVDFAPNEPDYKLTLTKPVEMTVSMATDEFCPIYFELDWYAKFLVANPGLHGRGVIDVRTKKEFLRRVSQYRKELLGYGVAADRMRYYHKHFHGERDEQFWLIPGK